MGVAVGWSLVWLVCSAASCQAPLLRYGNAAALVPDAVPLTAHSSAPAGRRTQRLSESGDLVKGVCFGTKLKH